jgi:CheY-like chemotaxis protein
VPAAPTKPPGKSFRVLVVDDSVDSADTLAELLKIWGHEVRVAHDGPGAVAAARDFRPDVVLLDIGLPGMDGFAVAQKLKDEGIAVRMLVALTGYGEQHHRERSEKAGFHHHLVKPVDPDALKKLIAGR